MSHIEDSDIQGQSISLVCTKTAAYPQSSNIEEVIQTQTNTARATVAPRLDGLARDEEGFLLDADAWTPELAPLLADESGLELTLEHEEVIHWIRERYERNDSVPEARTLLAHLREHWGAERATRRYLYRLFPRGYGQQACKIAGMRKPRKLMLDV
jgi:tRNA 2-thiouridine synthesizing protein E